MMVSIMREKIQINYFIGLSDIRSQFFDSFHFYLFFSIQKIEIIKKKMKIKVVFVGPSNAGKTSIINRFVFQEFISTITASTQPAFWQKQIQFDDQVHLLEIWDTAGQERYHSLSPLFYRDADIGIVVFDLTSIDSFNVAKHWVDELHMNRGDSINIAIVGNKTDLADQRVVSFETLQKLALETKTVAIETSAQTGENIDYLFETMTKKMVESGRQSSKNGDGSVEEKSHCWC